MTRYKFSFVICFFYMILACSSSTENSNQTITDGAVDFPTFQTKLEMIKKPQLVDVRTPQEFNRGTLKGAVNMNFYDKDIEKHLNTLDKSKPVFIFCQAGARSGKCYKKMKNMGFKEVYDFKGGYGEWYKKYRKK